MAEIVTKMKKIYLFVFFICCYYSTFAQRIKSWTFTADDYNTDTLRMDGYAYVCDTLMNLGLYYYNLDNHPGRGDVKYKDGTPRHLDEILAGRVTHVVINDVVYYTSRSIVDNAFSKEQAEQLEGQKFSIVLNISSADGSITDVYFKCWATGGYKNIPIEVFREIETRLKNEVQFELTEEGRKMNYCYLSWSQCPKGREDSGMTIPEDGGGMLTMPGGKLDGTIGGTIGTPSTTPTMP